MSEQEMHTSVEQRIIDNFLAREGVKPAEIWRRPTTQLAEETLSRTQVSEWHKKADKHQWVEYSYYGEMIEGDNTGNCCIRRCRVVKWILFKFNGLKLLHV